MLETSQLTKTVALASLQTHKVKFSTTAKAMLFCAHTSSRSGLVGKLPLNIFLYEKEDDETGIFQ